MGKRKRYETILVVSARKDDRVAFSEWHEAHPDGYGYVAGKKPRLVALTPAVKAALAQSRIRRYDPATGRSVGVDDDDEDEIEIEDIEDIKDDENEAPRPTTRRPPRRAAAAKTTP